MKLNIKVHTAESRIEKIKLDPALVELFDSYVKFYQQKFSASLTAEQAVVEMLTAFIKSDRNFMRWYRDKPIEQKTA